jgi:cell division protein FtsX
MKKIIFISAVIILLGLAGYVFVVKKSVRRESAESVPQKFVEVSVQPSPAAAIDINDNLDQALQDLDQVE